MFGKIINAIKKLPERASREGLYFIKDGKKTGLYVATKLSDTFNKIWDSEDYKTKVETDADLAKKATQIQMDDIVLSVDTLSVTKAEKSVVDAMLNGYKKMPSVDTYNDTSNGKTSLLSKYPNPEKGWDVLVRKDETKGGKSNRYNWNGEQWIDLETGVYDEQVLNEIKRVDDVLSVRDYFTQSSTFLNIPFDAILEINVLSDWRGQYKGLIYWWYMNNGNIDGSVASIFVNSENSSGGVNGSNAGIIAAYKWKDSSPKMGIEKILIEEVNFSGVNIELTIDWDKVPFASGVPTSSNTILDSNFLLKKYDVAPKKVELNNEVKDISEGDVFLVNKAGEYSPMNTIKFADLKWTNGKGYTPNGIREDAPMCISDKVPVSPGSKVKFPIIPSLTLCHVALDEDDNIVSYFGGKTGGGWEQTDLGSIDFPINGKYLVFTWAWAEQYSKHFIASVPLVKPILKWDDFEWVSNLAWNIDSKVPISSTMSVTKRKKVSSEWLEITLPPSSTIGTACFDKNKKLLGIVVQSSSEWGKKTKKRLFHGTKEVSHSYFKDQKANFSCQEIDGVEFSIEKEGLYQVEAVGVNYQIKLLQEDNSKQVEDLGESIKEVIGADYKKNLPIIPPMIFLRSDKDVYLNSRSMFSSIYSSIPMMITSVRDGVRKTITLQDGTGLSIDSIDSPAKIIVGQLSQPTKLVYKDVQVYKKDITTLQGKVITIMSVGDSITEGDVWKNIPVCMIADELEALGAIIIFVGTLARNLVDRKGVTRKLNYEGHGGFRYRNFIGLESKFAGLNQIIPTDQTKSEWMLGVDGNTMNEIKANNAFLFPATAEDLENYPQWCFDYIVGNNIYNKSYAEDNTKSDYYIFDPERYFRLRNIEKPDVLTIAFGTNEWYINAYGGFDFDKIIECFEFMIMRYRQALPDTKIVVIPSQVMMVGRDEVWKEKYSKLCSKVMLICEDMVKAGDNKLFVCPIYAQGSRFLAFDNTIGQAINIDANNSTKEIAVSQDVHYLYVDDESNRDYRESLAACVMNII